MKIAGIIPARYASTRFPGKPLVEIAGKSMIQRVYEQTTTCKELSEVIVATDDKRIFDHVISFGGKASYTSPDHQSGTDRCGEVLSNLDKSIEAVINIQGDEPFISPNQISLVCKCLKEGAEIATLVKQITNPEELFNQNIPKVTVSGDMHALYFSRNTIPFIRGKEQNQWLSGHTFYKHIGLYGFKATALNAIVKLDQSTLEKAEMLEQLRWLENGYQIKVAVTQEETIAIDTPEDLEKLKERLKGENFVS